MKLARAPWAATTRCRSATKSARRSGATAVSSTKAAGRSAPGAPMSSGRTAAAQGRRLGEVRRLLEPQPPARRRARRPAPAAGARPASASSSLPWYSTVSMASSCAGEQAGHAPEGRDVRGAAQRREVEELDRRGRRLEDREVRLQPRAQGGERERRAGAPGGTRVELHLELGEQRERALGAGQQPAQVGLRREQLAQVVAGRAAAGLREAGRDGLAVPLAHLRERRREPLPRRPARAGRQVAAGAGAERQRLAAGEHAGDAHAPCPCSRRTRWTASPTSCCRPCRRWSPGRRWRCRARTPDRAAPPPR